MLGAIIGDIVGSVYEFSNIKTKDFELFKPSCRFTDDAVMTCAVADAIMNGGSESDFICSFYMFYEEIWSYVSLCRIWWLFSCMVKEYGY